MCRISQDYGPATVGASACTYMHMKYHWQDSAGRWPCLVRVFLPIRRPGFLFPLALPSGFHRILPFLFFPTCIPQG